MEYTIEVIEFAPNPWSPLGDERFCAIASPYAGLDPLRARGASREEALKKMAELLTHCLPQYRVKNREVVTLDIELRVKSEEPKRFDITKVGKGRLYCRSED